MGTLLKTLRSEDFGRLREAYTVLASVYLAHRSAAHSEAASKGGFEALWDRVLFSEEPICLKLARQTCDLINTDTERPVEVFNQLGQIDVLIAADVFRSEGMLAAIGTSWQGESTSIRTVREHQGYQRADSNVRTAVNAAIRRGQLGRRGQEMQRIRQGPTALNSRRLCAESRC